MSLTHSASLLPCNLFLTPFFFSLVFSLPLPTIFLSFCIHLPLTLSHRQDMCVTHINIVTNWSSPGKDLVVHFLLINFVLFYYFQVFTEIEILFSIARESVLKTFFKSYDHELKIMDAKFLVKIYAVTNIFMMIKDKILISPQEDFSPLVHHQLTHFLSRVPVEV
jgi:hypothetical protein